MSAEEDFAEAVAGHRRAVEACVAALGDVPRDRWTSSPAPGKWSPGEIAEHLAISYEPPLSELAGGPGLAVRAPWWRRRLLRWKFLPVVLRGGFPRGAPAPREIRPRRVAADAGEAARALSENAERFLTSLAQARAVRRVRLTHADFGKLDPTQIVRLLTAHANHHRKQLPGKIAEGETT
jgi:DinB superfamily